MSSRAPSRRCRPRSRRASPACSAFTSRARSSTSRARASTIRPSSASSMPSAVGLLTSLRGGKTLVTLAPEMTTPEIIQKLVERRRRRLRRPHQRDLRGDRDCPAPRPDAASPTCSTRCRSSPAASPGVVGAALDDPTAGAASSSTASTLDPVVLRIALRCKRHDRFMLVTDAMPSVGTDSQLVQPAGPHDHGVRATCVSTRTAASPDPTSTWRAASATPSPCWDVAAGGRAHGEPALPGRIPRPRPRAGSHRAGLSRESGSADERLRVLETWIDGQSGSASP